MKRRDAIKYSLAGFAQVGLLGGCVLWNQSCTPTKEDAPLKVLTETELAILSILSDIMLPSSDTPGALEVGVPGSIDHFLNEFMNASNQQQIKQGLAMSNRLSQQLYQKEITLTSKAEQERIMQFLSEDGAKSKDKSSHFFYIIRGMIVSAYFQSEVVGKEVLKYDPIPGPYLGEVPLSEVGGQWTFDI